MTAETHAQQPDGSWKLAEPLPMAPGIDWEVYGRGPYTAEAFDGHELLVTVTAKTWLGFRVRLAVANWRLTRGN